MRRRLGVYLLLAGSVLWLSIALLTSLVENYYPTEPTAETFAALADGYQVEGEVGYPSCGSGGTHQCGFGIVVQYPGTASELGQEIARVTNFDFDGDGRKSFSVDESTPGRAEVSMEWWHQDPGPLGLLGILNLSFVVLLAGVAVLLLGITIALRCIADWRKRGVASTPA